VKPNNANQNEIQKSETAILVLFTLVQVSALHLQMTPLC